MDWKKAEENNENEIQTLEKQIQQVQSQIGQMEQTKNQMIQNLLKLQGKQEFILSAIDDDKEASKTKEE